MLQTFNATRYIVPLREGGSLPAVLDTDGGMFVAKFRGAGQGAKALIAEIIVAGIASGMGLSVPDVALVYVDESFGRSEPDPEIQDILHGSRGVNVGMRYLSGAFNYDPVAAPDVDPELAAEIIWLDAYVTNIDRTARNPNMMLWSERLWLIDHGAALYFHHNWEGVTDEMIAGAFPAVRQHVLLPFAAPIDDADRRLRARFTDDVLRAALDDVPDELLMDAPPGVTPAFATPEENRAAYCDYLNARLHGERRFVPEAERARRDALTQPSVEQRYRR